MRARARERAAETVGGSSRRGSRARRPWRTKAISGRPARQVLAERCFRTRAGLTSDPIRMDLDTDTMVKLAIYRALADSGKAPTSGDVAAATGLDEPGVLESF